MNETTYDTLKTFVGSLNDDQKSFFMESVLPLLGVDKDAALSILGAIIDAEGSGFVLDMITDRL